MSACMKCGAGITADNYHHEWSLMCDACYAQCEQGRKMQKMNWTTDYPTKSGFYWIRNYLRNVDEKWKQYEEVEPGPHIVEIDKDLEFFFTGSEVGRDESDLLSAEWQGPIEPDEQRPRPSIRHDLFPETTCATCLDRATKFVSWPISEVDGKTMFGFICYDCWIERLTPEQRKVYMV